MPINKEKLKEFLLKLKKQKDEAVLTHKQFTDNFAKVLKFLTSLKGKNQAEFKALNNKISEASEKLKADNSVNFSGLTDEISKTFDKIQKDQEYGMNFIRDKVKKIKDGVMGDSGKDGVDGKDGTDGKDAPTIRKIRRALKKKLKISDIKGLRKELDKKVIMTGSSGASGGGHVRAIDLSASLDTSTRTFSMPVFWKIISVHLSSFPNALRDTTDYVADASNFTIEFTSEIPINSLATGQTCIVVIAEP